jgi:hypothetical protein
VTAGIGPAQRAAWDTYLVVTVSLLPMLAKGGDPEMINPQLGGVAIRIRRYAPLWGEHGPMLLAALHSAIRLYRRGDLEELIDLVQAMSGRLFVLSARRRPPRHPGYRNQKPPRDKRPEH